MIKEVSQLHPAPLGLASSRHSREPIGLAWLGLLALVACDRELTPVADESIPTIPDTAANDPPFLLSAIGDITFFEDASNQEFIDLRKHFGDHESTLLSFEINTTTNFTKTTPADQCSADNPCIDSSAYAISATDYQLSIRAFAPAIFGSNQFGTNLAESVGSSKNVVFTISITASDGENSATTSLRLHIVNVDNTPDLVGAGLIVNTELGEQIAPITFADVYFDRDGDPIVVSAVSNLPDGINAVPALNQIEGVAGAAENLPLGSHRADVTVIYGESGTIIDELVFLNISEDRNIAATPSGGGFGYLINDANVESFESIGDINGDGVADFVLYDSTVKGIDGGLGRMYFVHGSYTTDAGGRIGLDFDTASTGIIVDGVAEAFGITTPATDALDTLIAQSAGDVNGDGFDDVLILRGEAGGNALIAGYLVYGDADLGTDGEFLGASATETVTFKHIALNNFTEQDGFALLGRTTSNGYGVSGESLGDINGDGYGDFAVMSDMGYVDIYFGGAISQSTLPNGLPTASPTDNPGVYRFAFDGSPDILESIVGLGDTNGDGYDDFGFGFRSVSGFTQGGALTANATLQVGAVIVHGRDFSDAAVLSVLDSSTTIDINDLVPLGYRLESALLPAADANALQYAVGSLARAHDINRDGYADIAFGFVRESTVLTQNATEPFVTLTDGGDYGEVYVLFGGTDHVGETVALDRLSPVSADDRGLGFTIRPFDPALLEDSDIANDPRNNGFGSSVVGIGDYNADGYADLAIAAAETDNTTTNALHIILYSHGEFHAGGLDFGAISSVTLDSLEAETRLILDLTDDFTYQEGFTYFAADETSNIARQDTDFASSVVAIGDANGDGVADLLIRGAGAEVDGFPGGGVLLSRGADFLAQNRIIFTGGAQLNGAGEGEVLIAALPANFASSSDPVALVGGGLLIDGRGGADVITGSHGPDFIVVPDLAFRRIDGSGGFDVLQFIPASDSTTFNIDLHEVTSPSFGLGVVDENGAYRGRLNSIEVINLSTNAQSSGDVLKISANAIRSIVGQAGRYDGQAGYEFIIVANSNDTIDLVEDIGDDAGEWQASEKAVLHVNEAFSGEKWYYELVNEDVRLLLTFSDEAITENTVTPDLFARSQIANLNEAPVLARAFEVSEYTANSSITFDYDAGYFSDPDGGPLKVDVAFAANSVFSTNDSGTITLDVSDTDLRSFYTIVIEAEDPYKANARYNYTFSVKQELVIEDLAHVANNFAFSETKAIEGGVLGFNLSNTRLLSPELGNGDIWLFVDDAADQLVIYQSKFTDDSSVMYNDENEIVQLRQDELVTTAHTLGGFEEITPFAASASAEHILFADITNSVVADRNARVLLAPTASTESTYLENLSMGATAAEGYNIAPKAGVTIRDLQPLEADFNGDGLNDLFVVTEQGGTVSLGVVFAPELSDVATTISVGFAADDDKAFWITGSTTQPDSVAAGDVNGDGIGDLVFAHPSNDSGTVHVVFGFDASVGSPPKTLDLTSLLPAQGYAITADLDTENDIVHDELGKQLVVADMDLDGIDDLVFSDPGVSGEFINAAPEGGAARGGVYIVYGNADGIGIASDASTASVAITQLDEKRAAFYLPPDGVSGFGTHLAVVDSVNGNEGVHRLPELIVGDATSGDGNNKSWLIFGQHDPTTNNPSGVLVPIDGVERRVEPLDFFGAGEIFSFDHVFSDGVANYDVNGDGYTDLFLSDEDDATVFHIFYGGAFHESG